jgi:hypothetical protein
MVNNFRDGLIELEDCGVEISHGSDSTNFTDVLMFQAFELIEREFRVSPVLSAQQMSSGSSPDPLDLITYLFYIYQVLKDEAVISSERTRHVHRRINSIIYLLIA